MKVSIIVPVYNTAPWLDRCIESLVNQTYQDIEIILVNDGSSDSSRQVCAYWQEKDQRIKYLYKENGGQASARNMGLDYATGEYIAFVDSDDCVSPDYVQKLLNMCLEHKTTISCCGYVLTDETTPAAFTELPQEEYSVDIIDRYTYFERMYTDKEILYVVVWNRIYHRSVFESLRFDENLFFEDEGITHHTLANCDRVAFTYEPLYYYAMRQGSTMKISYFRPSNMDILTFWQERMDYFESNGWQTLVYLTMKNYLVKCLELYNKIDSDTPEGTTYKNLLMQSYKVMLGKMKKYPVKSKKFILQMEYYGLFPKKFAEMDRNTFLFG